MPILSSTIRLSPMLLHNKFICSISWLFKIKLDSNKQKTRERDPSKKPLLIELTGKDDSEFDLEHQACELVAKKMTELEVPAQLTNKETAEDIRLVAYDDA
ncbi:hypothetical protein L2E82_11528 [Cichorium intybus]|uniref:Uncharacterized protein n=1 Tax=Cichorium intybus TaxID=13427 RepID=A0ACB9GES0_CICIN|nr:hypothetical protein L2E82_11528 [Cichorium intybus]